MFCFLLQPLTLDDDFPEVQKTVISGQVSTVVPIEIARRHNNPVVREELLLRTDVNQEEGSVYWHGLRLLQLDLSWIRKIHWVKRLRLARNGFRTIPNEIGGYLKQVGCWHGVLHHSLTTPTIGIVWWCWDVPDHNVLIMEEHFIINNTESYPWL